MKATLELKYFPRPCVISATFFGTIEKEGNTEIEGNGVNVRPNHVADVPKSGANGDGWMDGWMDE